MELSQVEIVKKIAEKTDIKDTEKRFKIAEEINELAKIFIMIDEMENHKNGTY